MRGEYSEPIPGVEESEVAGAVRSLVRVPEITLEDHERFTIEVRSLIVELRAQSNWNGESDDDMSVFLLVPYPRQIGERFGASPVFDLHATGTPIMGILFFLNRDASNGRAIALPAQPNSMLEWLADNGLANVPVVVLHRKAKLLVARARGCNGDARSEKIRDTPPVASLDELEAALNLSHRELLLTPSVCPEGVWAKGKSSKYIPGPLPENQSNQTLRIALTTWFRGVVKAEMEDAVTVGRIDIRLLRLTNDGSFVYWAIVELKVIKSFKHATGNKKPSQVTDKENAAEVAEGVRQARAFGKDRHAEPFLDVFDLRKDKGAKVLEHASVVNELAKCSLKPRCKVWPLFGSASDARIAGFP